MSVFMHRMSITAMPCLPVKVSWTQQQQQRPMRILYFMKIGIGALCLCMHAPHRVYGVCVCVRVRTIPMCARVCVCACGAGE